MRRKIKPIDPNELNDADDINRTTLKGEMRKLWPAIHKKLTEGRWTARDMVKWLDERGLSLSVELFRVYLRDIDREQGYNRATNTFVGADNSGSAQTSSTSSNRTRHNEVMPQITKFVNGGHDPPPATTTSSPLQRPPGITNSAWAEMQQKQREIQRRQQNLKGSTK